MKPKDLLEYLESGDRTMQDLEGAGTSTLRAPEGSLVNFNEFSRIVDPYINQLGIMAYTQGVMSNAQQFQNMQSYPNYRIAEIGTGRPR